VSGTSGHVYAVADEGIQLVVSTGESARRWGSVKKRLAFCRVTQDGDDEGCLTLDRLPTMAECELIREALAIRKAPAPSDATKSKLIARISARRRGSQGARQHHPFAHAVLFARTQSDGKCLGIPAKEQ
jgi:hypothetical protein